MTLIHATGSGCHTARLRVHLGNWKYNLPADASPAEAASVIESLESKWTTHENIAYPLHPLVESLEQDICTSSAEAIRIWLDPNDESIVPLDIGIEESPIYLPASDSEDSDDDDGLFQRVEDRIAALQKVQRPVAPKWDDATKTLWVGEKLIKRYKQPSQNQIAVLGAFEKAQWPTRIPDPIIFHTSPRPRTAVEKKVLSDTIYSLNRLHTTPAIVRFHGDSTGDGISWEFVSLS